MYLHEWIEYLKTRFYEEAKASFSLFSIEVLNLPFLYLSNLFK